MNGIQTWAQGRFIDQQQYDHMGDLWKDDRRKEESHLVRSGALENAICWCPEPDKAAWIAQRLNLASKLEKMTYDFVIGEIEETELIDFVKSNLGQEQSHD